MRLSLDYSDQLHVKIVAEFSEEFYWNGVCRFFPDCVHHGETIIEVSVYEFITQLEHLHAFCLSNTIRLEFAPRLLEHIKDFYKNQKEEIRSWGENQLRARLEAAGFHRKLRWFQMRNVCKLIQRNQGASFSVPGAGKTTEALAFFYAIANAEDVLLVVAPKNAFCAWDEQLAECTGDSDLQFTRITGSANVALLRTMGLRFYLMNYHTLANCNDEVVAFLRRHPNAFVFLDESHRVKNPAGTWARSVRQIATLPRARLVLSGTPMPQGPKDLLTQYNFLYPNVRVDESNVVERFKTVYVRTTADDLGITKIETRIVELELDAIEREIYKKMRSLSLQEASRLPTQDGRYLRNLGKCVMRLMAYVSNPALLADELTRIHPQMHDYLMCKDSKKVAYVCKRARQLAAENKKVIIWSTFVENVELIAYRLKDIGADYIHGQVDAGSDDDLTTREGKLKRFHKDPHAMVLVANPAAASEGISLHTVCQYAIYMDRSYNAAHFLQSQDRIHRLGLPEGTVPIVEIVQCKDTIDQSIDQRLKDKVRRMADALNDPSIVARDESVYSDETEGDYGAGLTEGDRESILNHLKMV